MKIEIKLEANCSETKIIIVAEKMTDEITALMQRISEEIPQGQDDTLLKLKKQ